MSCSYFFCYVTYNYSCGCTGQQLITVSCSVTYRVNTQVISSPVTVHGAIVFLKKRHDCTLITPLMCEGCCWFHVGYKIQEKSNVKAEGSVKCKRNFLHVVLEPKVTVTLHSLLKPNCCFGHCYFSTNMQVTIKGPYISKTWLPVQRQMGFAEPTLLGKNGHTNQET